MKYLARIFRIIVGLVFIFSGFVKSVDPYGSAYKITEYMGVFGFNGLIQAMPWLPIFVSIILCSLEFIIGILLVSGFFKKYVNWIVCLMMLFFTVLTFIDALTNKVADCGCFGDAVKLTNWETFFKNIIIDILLVVAIVFDKLKLASKKNLFYGRLFGSIVIVLVLCFTIYNALYEPLIDFRPWKEGNRIVAKKEDQKPPVSYATYKNNLTGKEREFGMDELMKEYQIDTAFASHWTFINSRVINTNTVAANGFSMIGVFDDKDKTFDILSYEGVTFIFTLVDLDSPSKKAIEKVAKFEKEASAFGCQTALVTATQIKKWADFTERNNWKDVLMYSTDDKAIETMMRSNPGVVMMRNGVVVKKWSWRCLPDFSELGIEKQKRTE
ncbi:MAG: BT_3928 family protein [Bacteroidales bacterium]|jgi:uncharacterized membrane protein YphA (DoxX/SURF4 family)